MLDNIVKKHISAMGYGESFRYAFIPKEYRGKMNRRILGESLAVASKNVRIAQSENARLKTKLNAAYIVASGEAVNWKEVGSKIAEGAKDIAGKIVKIIQLIISAITEAVKGLLGAKKILDRINKAKELVSKGKKAKFEKEINIVNPDVVESVARVLSTNGDALASMSSLETIEKGAHKMEDVDKRGNRTSMATLGDEKGTSWNTIKGLSAAKTALDKYATWAEKILATREGLDKAKKALNEAKKEFMKGQNDAHKANVDKFKKDKEANKDNKDWKGDAPKRDSEKIKKQMEAFKELHTKIGVHIGACVKVLGVIAKSTGRIVTAVKTSSAGNYSSKQKQGLI